MNNEIGQLDPTYIEYTDENGALWYVPEGHRFWDLYQQWLSQGNTPLPTN